MAHAIELANQAHYHKIRPNPRVGCVLVRDGQCIGEGWHQQLGGPHAEVNALANCDNATGATAYVSLEPCAHTGRTGPCSQALIQAGVARVVYGLQDPNPAVAGRGLEQLRAAGIEVSGPCLPDEAASLNPGFIRRMSKGLPYVSAKVAMSLDGKTAMASGESQWITGPEARKDGHYLRLRHCAIITGINTVLADDCQLTVRLEGVNPDEGPIRVILDSHGRLPDAGALWQSAAPVIWCVAHEWAKSSAVQSLCQIHPQLTLVPITQGDVGLDLTEVLNWLARERECNEVLVEAGAQLTGAFIQANALDELIVYQAPLLMGERARSGFALPFDTMSQAVKLTLLERSIVGCDQRLHFNIQKTQGETSCSQAS